MTWRQWLKNWKMTSLKIQCLFLDMEWNPSEPDKNAAWDLYIELLTRTTTQKLEPDHGDEDTALQSIFSLFSITRSVIKEYDKDCIEFTKIAVVILNQKIRPFTAKWHQVSISGGFRDSDRCSEFREELIELQQVLSIYTQMLAQMAHVEDLSSMEEQG